jgi:hypothetical protein
MKNSCGVENSNLNALPSYNFAVLTQFRDVHFRFLKVRPHGKEAIEHGWNKTANYSFNDPRIQHWIKNSGNYGLTCPSGFCCFVDADTVGIQETLENRLPQTFRYSTGKPGHFQYVYFTEDAPMECIPLEEGACIKGRGGYALGPGSVHPNGAIYGAREIRDIPIAIVKRNDLLEALQPFLLKKNPQVSTYKTVHERVNVVTPEQITKAASDLLPAWAKADHKRHALTLAIIGTCERSGWSKTDIQTLIDTMIKDSGKGVEHAAQVRYAYGREGKKYGIPALKEILEGLK